jgi:hypothetical protein
MFPATTHADHQEFHEKHIGDKCISKDRQMYIQNLIARFQVFLEYSTTMLC